MGKHDPKRQESLGLSWVLDAAQSQCEFILKRIAAWYGSSGEAKGGAQESLDKGRE